MNAVGDVAAAPALSHDMSAKIIYHYLYHHRGALESLSQNVVAEKCKTNRLSTREEQAETQCASSESLARSFS